MAQASAKETDNATIPESDQILGFVEHWAAATPDAFAVETADMGTLTYAQLLDRAKRLAVVFRDLGLVPGDRVAIQLPSGPEFITTYLACMIAECTLTTFHMPYRFEELLPLMTFSRARAVVTAEVGKYDGSATMLRLRDEVATLEHVLSISGWGETEALSFHDLIDAADPDRAPVAPGPDVDATLCFTSGTSAAPKGVLRSQRIMAENAVKFSNMLSMTAADRVMIAPPLSHVFGLLCAGNALRVGATVVPIPIFTPDTYAAYLTGMRPTVVYSAPAHLAATLKSGAMDRTPPETVRDVIVGGAICPPDVAAQFEDKLPNGRVGCLFGMTECLLTTQTDPADSAEIRHRTVGKLAQGLELRIIAGDGAPAAEGELQLRGYSVLTEYHENPAANEASFTDDGWFRTGDIASLDEAGNIMITGRVKDIINRGGIKINPSDIESLLDSHENIVQSAIVPMPDEVLGERICAYVALRSNTSLNLDDVCGFLAAHGVAKMRWPERLEVVDEMPMTPTRKIIKGVLVTDIQKRLNQGS